MAFRLKMCAFLFAHLLVANAQWAIEDENCRTPDHKVGICISILSCKHIMDILETASQPFSPKISELLRSSHCGFSDRIPKMCCPSKPTNIVDGITLMRNAPVPLPPDVSKHKNIRLLPTDCGILDTGDRIINGNKTGLFEYPWMALLSYQTRRKKGPKFNCGATIINEKYILTAAHCITNLRSLSLLGVRVGEHNLSTAIDCEMTRDNEKICAPPFNDLAIEEMIPHPDYNSTTHINDIGLLRVTPMDLSIENIKPVCLPLHQARTYNFTNKKCVVTGWGVTEKKKTSQVLLQVKISTVPNEKCAEVYENIKVNINHRQMCAGGKDNKDSCHGDSGGPLQVLARLHGDIRFVQQVVVSFGSKHCDLQEYPGVYTRVAYYMDWILDNMKS